MDKENQLNIVLFVDNDKNVLDAIESELINEKFTRLYSQNGKEALQFFKSNQISTIVANLMMENLNGKLLLDMVKKEYPVTTRIMMVVKKDVPTIYPHILSGDIHRYLVKPIELNNTFLPTLHHAIELFNLKTHDNELQKIIKDMQKRMRTQKDKIMYLKEIEEHADQKTIRVLRDLNKKINPFIQEILDSSEKINEIRLRAVKEFTVDLKIKLSYIQEQLRNVEDLLINLDLDKKD